MTRRQPDVIQRLWDRTQKRHRTKNVAQFVKVRLDAKRPKRRMSDTERVFQRVA